jgi:hypothetical protein
MVARTGVPLDSAMQALKEQADYWDAYEVGVPDDGRSAMACYLELVSATPKWIDLLMSIRNAVAGAPDHRALDPVQAAAARGCGLIHFVT